MYIFIPMLRQQQELRVKSNIVLDCCEVTALVCLYFFDSEEKGTQDVAKHNAKQFCDAMITNGYKAGIYASKSWFENYIGETWGYDLWIARYANALGVSNVDIWQYSSNGRVEGISGSCDVNHVYKDYGGSIITPSTPQKPVTHEKN